MTTIYLYLLSLFSFITAVIALKWMMNTVTTL